MDVVSPGSNIARQLPDLGACVPYPWGKITCRHNIISTLRFLSIVSGLKIYHHCLCYVFNHVDTSWPSGVLENQHVNWVQYFEYFCPGTPCSIQLQILQYISYHLYCTPAKFTFSNTVWKVFALVTNWKELTYNKRKWHSNMNPQSVKCLTHSQQLPRVVWSWGFKKGVFCTCLGSKGQIT